MWRVRAVFCSLMVLASTPLRCEEESSLCETDPSLVLEGVSLLTGRPIVDRVDLVLPGVDAVAFRRYFECSPGTFRGGWDPLPQSTLWVHQGAYGASVSCVDSVGRPVYFNIVQEKGKPEAYVPNIPKGSSNGGGSFSARQNPQLHRLHRLPLSEKLGSGVELTLADGTVREYRRTKLACRLEASSDQCLGGSGRLYHLIKEIRPTGNSMVCSYGEQGLSGVATYASNGERITEATVKRSAFRGPSSPWKGEPCFSCFKPMKDMTTSANYSLLVNLEDGRSLRYGMGAYAAPVKGRTPYWFLPVLIDGFGRSPEVIQYRFDERKVGDKAELMRVPTGIVGYSHADGSFRRYRFNDRQQVTDIVAPNEKGEEEVLFSLEYSYSAQGSLSSVCIRDCHDSRRIVHFRRNRLPESVEFYDRQQRLGKQEWYWSDDESARLIAKVIWDDSQGSEQLLRAEEYQYDDLGNVILKRIHGPYSGQAVQWNTRGTFPTCSEFIETRYQYNERHLLVRQDEPEGRFQIFQWDLTRALCTAQLTGVDGQVLQRTYSFYDAGANLVREVRDNGSGVDLEDWSQVTHREEVLFEINQGTVGKHLPSRKTSRVLHQHVPPEPIAEERFAYDICGAPSHHETLDGEGRLLWESRSRYNNGLKVWECSPVGGEFNWSYDALRRLAEERGPCGEKVRYEYGLHGGCIRDHRWDGAQERTTSRIYTLDGRLTSEVTPEGWSVRYRIGPFGRRDSEFHPRQFTMQSPVTRKGAPILQATGRRVKYDYDVLGRCLSKRCEHETRSSVYGACDQLLQETLPDGTERRWKRDRLGQAVRLKECDGTVTEWKVDGAGRIHTQKCGDQQITRRYHQEQLIEEIDPLGQSTRYSYDPQGRIATTDCRGQVARLFYDVAGRISGTAREGLEERRSLNAAGDLMESRTFYGGDLQRQESWERDYRGRVLAHHIWDGKAMATRRCEYDQMGRITVETDPMGISIRHEYSTPRFHDLLPHYCREHRTIHPNGLTLIERSTPSSEQVLHRSAQHQGETLWSEQLRYDLLERLKAVKRSCPGMPEQMFEWEHHPGGKLHIERHLADNRSLQTVYTYNSKGQLSHTVLPDGHWLDYSYDGQGRLSSMGSSDTTCTQAIQYDRLNRPVEISTPAGVERLQYDAWGNVVMEQMANGLSLHHGYDTLHQRTSTTLPSGLELHWSYAGLQLQRVMARSRSGSSLYDATVEMDLCGRPTSLQTRSRETSWSYDLNGRVSGIDHPAWSGAILAYTDRGQISQWQINDQTRGAGYDGLGHVVGNTDQAADRSYGVNGFGQRTSVDGNPSNPDPFGHPQAHLDQQLSWSNEGRLQQIAGPHGETTCRWDALGRMVGLKHGQSSLAFQYDHRHRCSRRTANQTEQNHLFTGRHHLGYVQGEQEVVRLLLPGACETGCMIARIEGDHVQEVLCDLQGSVVWVEGEGTTTYDVFGVSSQTLCEWGYRAKWTMAEVGWVDFGRRIYAPELGIFVSPDPKGVQEGWWDHHYCEHAPLGRVDPWGEEVMPMIAKAIGVVARCTPIYWARSSSEFYMCFPEDCGGQWPQAMNRFMEKQGRKDIYIVLTGINNSIEDHHRAVQGVATAAMARGNAVVIGIRRPDIFLVEGLHACADAGAWQLPSPATRGVCDAMKDIIRQAKGAGDFGECNITVLPHSAGAAPANAVGDALADMEVIHQADVLSVAGACPIMKDRENGSFRNVWHVYTRNDVVSHFGSSLRDDAIAHGIDCGDVEWVSAPEGGDKHGFWASQHLEAIREHTGLQLDKHFDPQAPVSSFIPRYEPSLGCLFFEHEKMSLEPGAEEAVA